VYEHRRTRHVIWRFCKEISVDKTDGQHNQEQRNGRTVDSVEWGLGTSLLFAYNYE